MCGALKSPQLKATLEEFITEVVTELLVIQGVLGNVNTEDVLEGVARLQTGVFSVSNGPVWFPMSRSGSAGGNRLWSRFPRSGRWQSLWEVNEFDIKLPLPTITELLCWPKIFSPIGLVLEFVRDGPAWITDTVVACSLWRSFISLMVSTADKRSASWSWWSPSPMQSFEFMHWASFGLSFPIKFNVLSCKTLQIGECEARINSKWSFSCCRAIISWVNMPWWSSKISVSPCNRSVSSRRRFLHFAAANLFLSRRTRLFAASSGARSWSSTLRFLPGVPLGLPLLVSLGLPSAVVEDEGLA